MTDTDRLAAIRVRRAMAHRPTTTGNVYVRFLTGDIDWLLARVEELEARLAAVEDAGQAYRIVAGR